MTRSPAAKAIASLFLASKSRVIDAFPLVALDGVHHGTRFPASQRETGDGLLIGVLCSDGVRAKTQFLCPLLMIGLV